MFSDDFIASHNDPADREEIYPHPILCPANRNTEARTKDLVCYLTDKEWTKSLLCQLRTVVPYRLVFNYWLDEYVKDYVTEQLWEKFFLGQRELERIIKLREISRMFFVAKKLLHFDESLPTVDTESLLRNMICYLKKRSSSLQRVCKEVR